MPKYTVEIHETLAHFVVVEADNEDIALDMGYDIVENADPSLYQTKSLGTYEAEVEEIDNA